MTRDKIDEFKELAEPLCKWLKENADPHSMIIIDMMGAQFLRGELGVPSDLAISYRK